MAFVTTLLWVEALWGITTTHLFVAAAFVYGQIGAAKARQKQAQARDAAERSADLAKGTKIVISGESTPLKILYGRNLVGGVRVYHNTFNNYVYAPPAGNGSSFSASSMALYAPTIGSRVTGRLVSDVTVTSAAVYVEYSNSDILNTITITVTKVLPAGSSVSGIVASTVLESGRVRVVLAAGSEAQSVTPTSTQTTTAIWNDDFNFMAASMENPFGFTKPDGSTAIPTGLVTFLTDAQITVADTDAMRNNIVAEHPNHEFLITQQALCFGGINACYSITVDDRKLIGETTNEFGEVVYPNNNSPDAFKGLTPDAEGWYAKSAITSFFDALELAKITAKGIQHINPYRDSCAMHFYPDGGVADPLVVANDPNRSTALFTNVAYVTSVYKYNRDDPQYNGVPTAQFVVEGLKVCPVVGPKGARTLGTKTYSNNPALCLLDYLTNTVYGRGLPLDELDLDSFYDAAQLCERVVRANVPPEGVFWRTKGGRRDVKLYECNLSLDSSSSIRQNIETLLETMNDAELVWSGGRYKLQLIYPFLYGSNAPYEVGTLVQWSADGLTDNLYRSLVGGNVSSPASSSWEIATAAEITDSDIVREGDTTISWPAVGTRLNYATVKFLNESKDFVEDTVYWPPQNSATNPVYGVYKAQDSDQELSTEVFATGCTSYYTALAKAEYLVRNSRQALTYSLNVNRDFIHLEPGDVVRVSSDILEVPGELMRVTAVTPDQETGVLKLSLTKYDAATLAWNVEDDEVGTPRNIYDPDLMQALNLRWRPHTRAENAAAVVKSYGVLTWDAPPDQRVTGYYVGYTSVPKDKVTRGTHYEILGQTSSTKMLSGNTLPIGRYTVGVVSHDANGKGAPQFGRNSRWPLIEIVVNSVPQVINLAVNIYDTAEEIAVQQSNMVRSAGLLTWDLPDFIESDNVVEYIVGLVAMTKAEFLAGPPWPAGLEDPAKRYPQQAVTKDRFYRLPDAPPGRYTIGVACRDARGNMSTEWASIDDHFTVIDFKIGAPFQAVNLQVREFTAAEAARFPGNPYGVLTWDPPPGGPRVKDYIVGYTPMTPAQFLAGPPWPVGLETEEKRYPWQEVSPTTSMLLPSTVAEGTYTLGVVARGDTGVTALEWDDSVIPVSHWPIISVTKGPLGQPRNLAYHKYTPAEQAALITPAWGKVTWDKAEDARVAYYTIGYVKGTVANNKATYLALAPQDQADTTVTSFTIPFMPNGVYTVGVVSRDAQGNQSPWWYELPPFSVGAPSKVPLIEVTVADATVSNLAFSVFNKAQSDANGSRYGKLTWTAPTETGTVEYVIGWRLAGGDWLGFETTRELYWIAPIPPAGNYIVGVGTKNGDGVITDKATWPTVSIAVGLPSNINVSSLGYILYDATLKAASGGASGKVYWTASTDPSVVDYVISYKMSPTGDWQGQSISTVPYWVAPDAPAGTYYVGVATRNKDGVVSAQAWPTIAVTLTTVVPVSEQTKVYSARNSGASGNTDSIYITVPTGYVANGLVIASASVRQSTTQWDAELSLWAVSNGVYFANRESPVRGTVYGTASNPVTGSFSTQATITEAPAGTYQVWAQTEVIGGIASGYVDGVFLSVTITLRKL